MENNVRFAVDPRTYHASVVKEESGGLGSIFSRHRFLFIILGIVVAFILILVIGNFVIRPMFNSSEKAEPPNVVEGLRMVPGVGYLTPEYYASISKQHAKKSTPQTPPAQQPQEEITPEMEYDNESDSYDGNNILPEDVDEISEYILGVEDD